MQGSRLLIAGINAGSIFPIFVFITVSSFARGGLGLIFNKPVFNEVIGGFFNGHIRRNKRDP